MDHRPVGNGLRINRRAWCLPGVLLAVLLAGCSTNLNEVLLQSGAATGRTLIDLWLTDFQNRLIDSFDRNRASADDGGSTTD